MSIQSKINKIIDENHRIEDEIFDTVSNMDIPETIIYNVEVPDYTGDIEDLLYWFEDQYHRCQYLDIGEYYEEIDISINDDTIQVTYTDLDREALNEGQIIGFSNNTCYHDDCNFSINFDTYFCSIHYRDIDEDEANSILYKNLKIHNARIKDRLNNIKDDLTPPKKIYGDVCVPNDTYKNDTHKWILTLVE